MSNEIYDLEERKRQFVQMYENEASGVKSESSATKNPQMQSAVSSFKAQVSAEKTGVPVKKAPATKKVAVTNKKGRQAMNVAKSSLEVHDHPSMQPNVRTERAYVESTAEGTNAEGCNEHYSLRFVSVNKETKEEHELTPLEKIMVYGDCLLYPKFKEY